MKIQMSYGKSGLDIEIPEYHTRVLTMKNQKAVADPSIAITKSLLKPIATSPLYDLAKGKKNACILICDITRPVPNRVLLPPILRTLRAAGMPKDKILILVATGIHRPNLEDEINELVGPDIARDYLIENHMSREKSKHKYLGTSSRGTEMWIDERYMNSDFKLATGFIEPHLMAGFSGGRKLIVPGIAGVDTMKVMHGPHMMADANCREGIIDNNPFHEEALEIANTAGVDFIVHLALNENKEITGIFSGHLEKAHLEGIEFVKESVRATVDEPVDIAITSSAGYPLDKTWYQAIKGVTAAANIVKKGGTIILTAECSEGIGSEEFSQLVYGTKDLDSFLKTIFQKSFFVIDQWQLQKYAQVAKNINVVTVAGGLSKEQKNRMNIPWAETVTDALEQALKRHGNEASIAAIPKGPYVLSQIEGK